ncbi:MAG: TonB-dependent receptor plug domain-containing protein [Bacteroidota bacterium]
MKTINTNKTVGKRNLTLMSVLLFLIAPPLSYAQETQANPRDSITEKTIKDYNWHSLNDVLYKQAGFFPSQDYERATVGSRGIPEGWNNNHLLLLVDGVPFNTGLYGTAITTEFTPLIFTKSLEITKGPGSARYGTYAINGVINMNSVSASDYSKTKVFARTSFGERNTMFHNFLATFKTKPFDITASFTYTSTRGEEYLSCDGSMELDTVTNSLKKLEPQYGRFGEYFFFKLEGKGAIQGLSMQVHSQTTQTKTGFGWLWNIPDQDEEIKDNNNSLVLKYQKDIWPFLNAEIAAKYTRIDLDWNMWYYRSGALNNLYPDGVNEVLKTSFNNLFTRMQFTFKLPRNSTFVLSSEPTFFHYSGDRQHYSNIDLFNTSGGQPRSYRTVPLGSYLELIENRVVNNIGSFAQFSTGELLGKHVLITAGLRYDNQFYNYVDLDEEDQPVVSNYLGEFSPRLSIAVFPSKKISMWLTAAKGFRAPVPTELFGRNTWAVASNIDQVQPERIKTAELTVDYAAFKHFDFRANVFYTMAEGLVGYSLSNNNLSTNLYDLTNAGIEGEVLFTEGNFSAFANVSYVKRIDEKIYENELQYVSLHTDKLTWAPSVTTNIGVIEYFDVFKFSLQGHFQDKVMRRDKDFYSAEELAGFYLTGQPRSTEVNGWISLDAQFTFRYNNLEFGISGTNLLDSDNYLIKNMKYPFDYKMESRRISLILNIEL